MIREPLFLLISQSFFRKHLVAQNKAVPLLSQ
nr:MAG TPA: hypothetical protein [Caudoviricetes sp.]